MRFDHTRGSFEGLIYAAGAREIIVTLRGKLEEIEQFLAEYKEPELVRRYKRGEFACVEREPEPEPKKEGDSLLGIYDMGQAVLVGSQLLDGVHPGWRQKVDVEQFDMAYHGRCLLSQLYGSFAAGIKHLSLWLFLQGVGPLMTGLGDLNLDALVADVHDSDGWDLGFTLPPWTKPETLAADYAQLTKKWRAQLRANLPGEENRPDPRWREAEGRAYIGKELPEDVQKSRDHSLGDSNSSKEHV